MLKAHQACIDLQKDVLRIQGREVKFLPEHELPLSAQDIDPEALASASTSIGTGTGSVNPSGGSSGPSFPGSGRAIGSSPGAGARPSLSHQASSPQSSRQSEVSIKTLMDLGASREQAISLLDAAGGNVDVAASLMF
jgi:DNA damage-inducible protein 1